MSSAVDRLPVAEAAPSCTAPATPEPSDPAVTKLHQALCWFPNHRSSGLEVTEALAETALRNNAQLPPEPVTAVRIKIRTDGAGVRFAKRLLSDGRWELCFASLDPWLCDIVEQLGPDGVSRWHVSVAPGSAIAWNGTWDDRPVIEGFWIGAPWLRVELVP